MDWLIEMYHRCSFDTITIVRKQLPPTGKLPEFTQYLCINVMRVAEAVDSDYICNYVVN